MTICFTLPYSSAGREEGRIKFDLLTAIIKRSPPPVLNEGPRLTLLWLALKQRQDACSALSLVFHFRGFILSSLLARAFLWVLLCLAAVKNNSVSPDGLSQLNRHMGTVL